MSAIQNNLTYQKSNVVISSFMSITIHGYRLMSYINYKTQEIEKAGKLPDSIRLYVNEMADLLDMPNNGEKYKLADLATKELSRAVMYCYDRKSGDIKKIVIFPEITFHNDDNSIEINTQIFNYAMMRRHKDNYTICTLEDAKNFRSIYSARISDYLRMEAYGKNEIAEDVYEIEVDLTELKLMAGTIVLDDEVNFAKIAEIMDNISNVAVENKYSEWKRFKEKILDKAVRDINKNTNLSVSYETKRTGRGGKTSRVIFRVEKKAIKDHKESAADCQKEKNKKKEPVENKSMEPVSQKPEPTKEQFFEMCMEVNKIVPFSIDLDTCMTLIKDSGYDVSAVKTAVEVLKQQGGETKSPIGFLRKAVKENWKPSVVSYSGQKKRKSFDNAQKWEYDEDEIKDLEKMLLQTPVRQ